MKSDAVPSIFPWKSSSSSNQRAKRQAKRNEAKVNLELEENSDSSDDMSTGLPSEDCNVGNEIYIAEPCEDVEMDSESVEKTDSLQSCETSTQSCERSTQTI